MESEEKLVLRAKQGHREAFGALYDKHLSPIFRFIMLKVGSKEDAEDLTHQVFLKAWENMGSFNFQGFPFSSWLYRIASNTVIDHYRTRKQHAPIDELPEEMFSKKEDISQQIDQEISLHAVRIALTKLKSDEQNIVVMKFVNELSNKEISQITEKTEGAIRVIQHRALKQIRKHLEKSEKHDLKTI